MSTTAPPVRTRKRRGNRNRQAAPPPKRGSHIADLFDVQAIEQDGLFINSAGEYVRVIECQFVPNVISADESTIRRIEAGWQELCASIPDHHRLSFYAQVDPIPIDDALEQDRDRVEAAIVDDLNRGDPEFARTRRRFLQAQRQSVTEAARGEQPAVATRYWVAVPHRPMLDTPGERFRDVFGGGSGGSVAMTWESHQRAAIESENYTRLVVAHLTGMGIDTHIMGPVEILAAGWERLHPAATELPDFDAFATVADIVRATDPEAARAHREKIVAAVTAGDAPCGIDDRDARWLRHADGTVEETLHLATTPALTTPWWLSLLLEVPLPGTVAVHIGVRNRAATRSSNRRHWARLRAAHTYKLRRGRIVGFDEEEALQEAAEVDRDLSTTVNATLYDVAIYASYRHTGGNADELNERMVELTKSFQSFTDARVLRGRFLNVKGLRSTLPLGTDALKATRRYAPSNVAHCVPLTTAACGSPDGLMLGFADPGGTLERINPYDSLFTTHVTLVVAPSGSGKTVLTNALLARGVSQGMRGFIIDRSSTRDEHGSGRSQGHYDALLSLVPGSRTVQVGSGTEDIINPWDVEDVANVSSEKTEMLLALHALLIGNTDAAGERHLEALEEALLMRAITQVYRTCTAARAAGEDARPRETMLVAELDKIAAAPAGGGTNADGALVASTINALLAKLQPFTEGEPYEHIADLPTTVATDAPLTLFDIAGAPERLIPALILTIVDHIDTVVQRTRARRVSGAGSDLGPWAGRQFLLVEEGWKVTASSASGRWLNEYARRSRHLALWLIFVTQHFQDLDNEQGRALMENANLKLCLPNIKENDLEFARERAGLTDADIRSAMELTIRKGVYSSVYVVSPRGRGRVRILLGNLEYWICSNDPDRDQPRRVAALRDADGDSWKALRLLCTPSWHEEFQRATRDG